MNRGIVSTPKPRIVRYKVIGQMVVVDGFNLPVIEKVAALYLRMELGDVLPSVISTVVIGPTQSNGVQRLFAEFRLDLAGPREEWSTIAIPIMESSKGSESIIVDYEPAIRARMEIEDDGFEDVRFRPKYWITADGWFYVLQHGLRFDRLCQLRKDGVLFLPEPPTSLWERFLDRLGYDRSELETRKAVVSHFRFWYNISMRAMPKRSWIAFDD